MNAFLSWLDSFWSAYKARKAARAMADLAKGKEILDQAEREAAEMEAARKGLDERLNATPAPAAVAPVAPAAAVPPAAAPAAAPAAPVVAPPPVPAEPPKV